jgi:hypothetical protein
MGVLEGMCCAEGQELIVLWEAGTMTESSEDLAPTDFAAAGAATGFAAAGDMICAETGGGASSRFPRRRPCDGAHPHAGESGGRVRRAGQAGT